MGYQFSEIEEELLSILDKRKYVKDVKVGVSLGAIIHNVVPQTIEYLNKHKDATEEEVMDFIMDNVPE